MNNASETANPTDAVITTPPVHPAMALAIDQQSYFGRTAAVNKHRQNLAVWLTTAITFLLPIAVGIDAPKAITITLSSAAAALATLSGYHRWSETAREARNTSEQIRLERVDLESPSNDYATANDRMQLFSERLHDILASERGHWYARMQQGATAKQSTPNVTTN